MNKRAWLNHLGQPGCGRQSAGRPRPKHQEEQDRSSHFLGAGRNTAAGRGRGGGALFTHNGNSDGGSGGFGGGAPGIGRETAVDDAVEPLPVDEVGILGCRCEACLTEGDDHELDHEQQERLERRRWRQHERQELQLPPRYDKPPPPYNDQPPPRYNEACPPPTPPLLAQPAAASAGAASGVWWGGAARGASKSWPSPEDWDREDDLGWKGSRSYSPGSASGSSPLYEACETYDDEGSYFFDR